MAQDRNAAIYLRKTDGSPAVRLGDGNRPALSPDGKWVACMVSDGSKRADSAAHRVPAKRGRWQTGNALRPRRVVSRRRGILFTGNEPTGRCGRIVQDVRGGEPSADDAGKACAPRCFARREICDGGPQEQAKLDSAWLAESQSGDRNSIPANPWFAGAAMGVTCFCGRTGPYGDEDQPPGCNDRPRGTVERAEACGSGGSAYRSMW